MMSSRRRTLLIGLDGATFTVLDPLMDEGLMPFLRRFVASGVRAELRSVIPALTPPAWTSLATGRSPGGHGIFDFFRKERPDSAQIRVATSRDVGAETIWSLADRNGLRVTALNFPLMFPPPKIAGNVVPGWMPWRQMRLGCHPEGLFDRIKALPGLEIRELAMDMEIEAQAIEGCGREEYEEWIELHIRRERHWSRILQHLMEEDPCELTAVLFDGVDKIQHLCWRFLDPRHAEHLSSDWERRVRERCRKYFRELDRLLAEIVERAGPEATVVLASDHGFGAQEGTFFVNSWLEQRGDLAWSNGAPRTSDSRQLGLGQLARHGYLLDWRKTRAYAATPSSNGVHIVAAAADREGGVPADEYARYRDRLRRDLLAATDPQSGQPIVAHVWSRDEIFTGPYESLAPDLTLEMRDGGLISILRSDAAYKPRREPAGTHRPAGVFIGRGPGWRQGDTLPELSILDVAPLLVHAAGLEVPADMEGRVPEDVFTTDFLAEQPVRYGPGGAASEPATDALDDREEPIYTEDDERRLEERLRALGYIE